MTKVNDINEQGSNTKVNDITEQGCGCNIHPFLFKILRMTKLIFSNNKTVRWKCQ